MRTFAIIVGAISQVLSGKERAAQGNYRLQFLKVPNLACMVQEYNLKTFLNELSNSSRNCMTYRSFMTLYGPLIIANPIINDTVGHPLVSQLSLSTWDGTKR